MKNFNQLYFSEETQNVVKSLSRRIAGNDNGLKNDLSQEAYLILQKAAEYFDIKRGAPFWGFAYVVLRNELPKAKNRITQVLSINEQDIVESLDELEGYEAACKVLDCNLAPCERYELEDTRRAIRKAVNLLPRNERVAISLLYGLDGLYERTLTNVAEQLGCSVEGARKTRDRAVNRLRVMFDEPDFKLCA